MPFLSTAEAVKVHFKTKGLDNKPYEVTQLAKVIHHRKHGGWLKLQFKNGVISQYRVRRDEGFWHNWEKDKVYLKVESLVNPFLS